MTSAPTPRLGSTPRTAAIGSAVQHPLVAHLDDATLRSHLLCLTRRLVDLPG